MGERGYCPGDYQTMCTSEKIEFLHKVHTEEISLWDDDGNDNEIWNDYHALQEELLNQPEILNCEELLHLMKIFNDDCFELSWQLNLSKILCRNCLYYGKERIAFYLQHLEEVPSNGRLHGWHFPIQWLLNEKSFALLKEAVQAQTTEIKETISNILNDINVCPAAASLFDG